MACTNSRNSGCGCRRAVQSARWPGCGYPGDCPACNTSCGNTTGSCSCCQDTSCGTNSSTNCCCTNTSCGSTNNCCHHTCCGNTGGSHPNCWPFYCGPCGTTGSSCGCVCGCTHCPGYPGAPRPPFYPPQFPPQYPPQPRPTPRSSDAYGTFIQNGSLSVAAGGVIPFGSSSTASGMSMNGGMVTLEESGVYLVSLSAVVPDTVLLDTTLNIQLNGANVPGGAIVIDKTDTTAPLYAGVQTVVSANAGSVISVSSTDAISFAAEDAANPIASLTIVKIA